MELALPSSPRGERIACKMNYFSLLAIEKIFCYKITITPELPENKISHLIKIIRNAKKQISSLLPVHIINNFRIYSTNFLENDSIIIVTHDEMDFKLKLNVLGDLSTNDCEYQNFLGRFFKVLQNKLSLKLIGKKYFDSENKRAFPKLSLEIWPGYFTSLNKYGSKIMMNIDPSYKILREETVYDYMEELRKQGIPYDQIDQYLLGQTVMTKYNRRLYQIRGVEWKMNPKDRFTLNNKSNFGEAITYYQYYEKKYGYKIRDVMQPLLKNYDKKNPNMIIYLVPEFCCLTGLSENQRNDHILMKEISSITKPDPQKRMDEALKLLHKINDTKETKKILDDWGLTISEKPEDIYAYMLDAGSLVMGKINEKEPERHQFPLNSEYPLEKKATKPMFNQPDLQKWAIFCPENQLDMCKTFTETLKLTVDLYQYPANEPKIFPVKTNSWQEWEIQLSKLNSTVQAVIALLPGNKRMAPLYNQVKSLLISRYPIPSQVVILSTIKNRNLKSICHKILIQICAKIGGIPWAISNMPFAEKPTMIIGVDMFHKPESKKPSIVAICATMDRFFCKYWSTYKVLQVGQPISTLMMPTMIEALNEFKSQNKVFPLNIIVYREGVPDTMRKSVEEIEVGSFRRSFESLGIKPKLIYITVTKGVSAKFYVGDNLKRSPVSNPQIGSLFKDIITDGFDFYLISQKAMQGTATPSHYYIMVNDYEDNSAPPAATMSNLPRAPDPPTTEKIQLLSYKLCYMYYNWMGSIKIPAPIQYAHKLAALVGDKLGNKVSPSEEFSKRRCLYFI